jgi:hypothetical protein
LKECTKVLPGAVKAFTLPDAKYITEWLNGGLQKVGSKIRDGETITSAILKLLGLLFGREFVA